MGYGKINWAKTFNPEPHIEVRCGRQNTSYGFRHLAEVYSGYRKIASAKACYYNRTWESYEFQSVAHAALRKAYPEDLAKIYCDTIDGKGKEDALSGVRTIGFVAAMGSILATGQEAQNDWKLRMLKAGLGDSINMPDDWASLSEDEKTRRLDGAISELRA